jgi:SAM-dependent methyltransferase
MLAPGVIDHLRRELSREDPFGFAENAFERRRLAALEDLIGFDQHYQSGLEIGCAAGATTEFLVPRCTQLRVVDVLPEAIVRCRARLGDPPHVAFAVSQIGNSRGWRESYDVIVVSEVLYYLGARLSVVRTIAKLKRWLRPGGIVIFGSARDRASRRWGLPCGAETAMREWSRDLTEVRRRRCRGATPDEDCILVRYCFHD